MRAFGIDISNWNTVNDWAKVAKDPQRPTFAFIKSTEGAGHLSYTYESQWEGAGSVNLLRGAHHFFLPQINASSQASWFMGKSRQGEMPPALDLEDVAGAKQVGGAATFEGVRVWLQNVKAAWGVTPIVYTGMWYLQYLFGLSPNYDARWLAAYPLWIAHWTNYGADPTGEPTARPSWWGWKFWQYYSSGSIDGISGRVDINYFN